MSTVKLHSVEIACEGCVNSIKRALMTVGGVQDVTGEPAAKTVEVTFEEGTVTINDLLKKLDGAGFPATIV